MSYKDADDIPEMVCTKCGATYNPGFLTMCDKCWDKEYPRCAKCDMRGDDRCLAGCWYDRLKEAGVEDICSCHEYCEVPNHDGMKCQKNCTWDGKMNGWDAEQIQCPKCEAYLTVSILKRVECPYCKTFIREAKSDAQ